MDYYVSKHVFIQDTLMTLCSRNVYKYVTSCQIVMASQESRLIYFISTSW